MDKSNIEVSVIVPTFHSELAKIKKTIHSVAKQREIALEIIIADDGSLDNHFAALRSYFHEIQFDAYSFVGGQENIGTCANIIRGLCNAKGRFTKLIAPGDCLFDGYTLRKWVDYMLAHHVRVSFCEAVCYLVSENGYRVISVRRKPQLAKLYLPLRYHSKMAALDYVLLNDAAFGASFLTDTAILRKYLYLCTDKIKYTEDMAYRVMLCDGEKMLYYPHFAVWYEYGTGISTAGNGKWNMVIEREKRRINTFLQERDIFNGIFGIRFKMGLRCISISKCAMFKYLVLPELILLKIKKDSVNRFTARQADLSYLENL